MTIHDSWAGLVAPSRGAAIEPRHLPPAIRSRAIPRAQQAQLIATGAALAPARGILCRVPTPGSELTPTDRVLVHARAVSLTHHEAVFSHDTAALLLGAWLMRPRLPVHLRTAAPASSHHHRSNPHVVRHRGPFPDAEIRAHQDVLITSAELTALDCARSLPLIAAVVACDSLLRIGADPERMRALRALWAGGRGMQQARTVFDVADGKPESPGESASRMNAVLAGLPAPEAQVTIATRLGEKDLDLAWRDRKAAIEFDGAMKVAQDISAAERTRRLHEAMDRHAAILEAGWAVLRLRWNDLHDPPALQARLRRFHRDHGG